MKMIYWLIEKIVFLIVFTVGTVFKYSVYLIIGFFIAFLLNRG